MRSQQIAMSLIVVVLLFYILHIGQRLLLPLVIAGAVAYLISILSHTIQALRLGRLSIPRPIAIALAIAVIGLSLTFLLQLITLNIRSVIAAAPEYQRNIEALIYRAYRMFGAEEVPNIREILNSLDLRGYLQSFATTVRGLLSSVGIITVYLIFLLLEQRTFADKLRAILPSPNRQKDAFHLIDKMRSDIRTYVGIKVLTSMATGILSYLVLTYVGVDFASFWAVLIFLLNFIPTIGSIIATAFPSLLALVQFETYGPFFATVTILTIIQFCIGSLIEPRLMGNRLNLSPIVILLSLGLWGSIWGIPGMFLCVPITVIIMIICSYSPRTRPIAILLSGNGLIAGDYISSEKPIAITSPVADRDH